MVVEFIGIIQLAYVYRGLRNCVREESKIIIILRGENNIKHYNIVKILYNTHCQHVILSSRTVL